MAKNYMSENDYKNADYTTGKNASNKAQDKSQNKSQNKNSTNSSENCGKNASNADKNCRQCETLKLATFQEKRICYSNLEW